MMFFIRLNAFLAVRLKVRSIGILRNSSYILKINKAFKTTKNRLSTNG